MKKNRTFLIVLSFLIAFVILVILDLSGITPNITERKSFIDLNSGDRRLQKYIFSIKVKDKISMSAFSEEVRRFGIEVPTERIWKSIGGSFFRFSTSGFNTGYYYFVDTDLQELYSVFEMCSIPDNERIITIKDVLDCLKKLEPMDVDHELRNIISKYWGPN